MNIPREVFWDSVICYNRNIHCNHYQQDWTTRINSFFSGRLSTNAKEKGYLSGYMYSRSRDLFCGDEDAKTGMHVHKKLKYSHISIRSSASMFRLCLFKWWNLLWRTNYTRCSYRLRTDFSALDESCLPLFAWLYRGEMHKYVNCV